MELGKAVAIFKNIYLDTHTREEKMQAIKVVLDMETYNGITKQELLEVLNWLLTNCGGRDILG